jgi:hypothetical protein
MWRRIVCAPHGRITNYSAHFRAAVVLGQIDGVQLSRAVGLFDRMIAEVERRVAAIEVEARRLGLGP